jgi:hypothetical protein
LLQDVVLQSINGETQVRRQCPNHELLLLRIKFCVLEDHFLCEAGLLGDLSGPFFHLLLLFLKAFLSQGWIENNSSGELAALGLLNVGGSRWIEGLKVVAYALG